MANERLRNLIAEFRLAEKRLNDIQAEYLKLATSTEVIEELKKEFNTEIRRANEGKDLELAKQWKKLRDEYLTVDQDSPDSKRLDSARRNLIGKNQELILYYTRKLKVIKKLIGTRESELLESLEEKNILIGQESGSARLIHDLDEEARERVLEEKKKNINFDRM